MPVPERKEPFPEISDEEYARLSAEKQVFEKAKNRGKNPAVKKEVEEEMVSSSSASSVNLGPVAGEVSSCISFPLIFFISFISLPCPPRIRGCIS